MIYLEQKGGLIKNYGVSVVIDSSNSCFNYICFAHSIQTIQMILSSLNSIDLPCFDLIIAKDKPHVLCSEVNTLRSLNSRSPLWELLISELQNSSKPSDLASSIHAAYDLKRMRTIDYSGVLFVLTDGLYQESVQYHIKEMVEVCIQSGINVFGIGIGIYPKGIEKLFPHIVYSPNPYQVLSGISSFFSESSICNNETMPFIQFNCDIGNIISEIQKLITYNQKKEPVYKELKSKLNNIEVGLDAFDDMINDDIVTDSTYYNPEGKNTEMYSKDLLKGQKILIVMLWNCEMSEMEQKCIHQKYIFQLQYKLL